MTNEYRTQELARAETEYRKARQDYDAATCHSSKADADDRMQFWGKKKDALAMYAPQEGR